MDLHSRVLGALLEDPVFASTLFSGGPQQPVIPATPVIYVMLSSDLHSHQYTGGTHTHDHTHEQMAQTYTYSHAQPYPHTGAHFKICACATPQAHTQCISTHTCMHAYSHLHTGTYRETHILKYTHVHIHSQVYKHTHTYTCL